MNWDHTSCVQEAKFHELLDRTKVEFTCSMCKSINVTTEDFPKIYKFSCYCDSCYNKFLKNNKEKYNCNWSPATHTHIINRSVKIRGVIPEKTYAHF